MSDSDNTFDINIGTEVDQSSVEKSLKDVEKKVKDSAKKQTKEIQEANKKNIQSFKDFAKAAGQELLGIDQMISVMAGGPAAMGKAVVDMGKKAVAALNAMAEEWREQEKAEIALQNAAKNNPYLNERSVRQLKKFADEMQNLTGIDNSQVLQTETRLASLGRNQEQIQRIIKTATDMAAAGVMSYDEAVNELNGSLNGVVRTSARLYPELKNLSKEALASGEAIDIIAGKVSGAAAEAMQTGAGSVTAYQNAIGNLKKLYGEDWDNVTRGFRNSMTKYIERLVAAKVATKELKAALAELSKDDSFSNQFNAEEAALNVLITRQTELNERIADNTRAVETAYGRTKIGAESNLRANQNRLAQVNEEIAQLERVVNVLRERNTIEENIADTVRITTEAYNATGAVEAQERMNSAVEAELEIRRLLENVNRRRYEIENAGNRTEILQAEEAELNALINRQRELNEITERGIEAYANRNYHRTGRNAAMDLQRDKYRLEQVDKEIERKREYINLLNEELSIEDVLASAWSRANQAESLATAAELESSALENQRNANEFREENQKALDAEIAKILRKAEIEGKSADDLQVKKQILDANVQAYENLLNAAKEFIDGTTPEEQARFAWLKETWADYDERAERERVTDEERKRRLAKLAKEQEETQEKLNKIYQDAINERDRLFDLQAEQEHQNQLEEIVKKSLKRSIDFETQYRIQQAESQQQKILENFDEEYDKKIDQIRRLREAEMEQYAEGSAARLASEEALEEEINQLKLEYQEKRDELRVQSESNLSAQIVQIEKDAAEEVTKAWQAAWNKALSEAQEYLNAASSIASSISTIWHNSIDYKLNEDLKANDKMIQSDEERAAAEKKIMMESAYEKYKADMFMWSANIALATANAAMAVLKTIADYGATPTGIAMASLAGVMGAFQVAAVISAQPQPPRFHTGGIVPGRAGQEVPAILRAGEPVLTQDQFGNVMKAFANVANSRYGGGGTNLVVNVKNNAANTVSTQQSLSPEGLEIVITQIVKKNLSNGGLDDGLAQQRSHAGGINITT